MVAMVRATGVLLAVGLVFTPSMANADDGWDEARDGLAEIGVAADRIEPLIDRLQNGEKIDSFGGVDPVSTSTRLQAGRYVTKHTYPDGSVSVSKVDRGVDHAKSAGTAGVSGCSVTGPSYVRTYTNCTVDSSNGLISGGFRADYKIWETSADQILDVYSASYYCLKPVTCSGAGVKINRGTEKVPAKVKAEAEETFSCSAAGIDSVCHIWLRVGSNAAKTERAF